jgi:hypothetical protein
LRNIFRKFFGIVCKVIHKNCNKIDAINKIALNKQELEKAFKGLNLMKGLKSRFVVEYFDSWIEKNESSSHSNGVLLSRIK